MEDNRASINSINIFIAHDMGQIEKIMYSVICIMFIFDEL